MSSDFPETRLLSGTALPRTPEPPQTSRSEISFRQLWGVIRRRYRLLLLMAVLGAAVGAYLSSQEPREYQARSTFRMAGERRALTGNEDVADPDVNRMTDPILSLVQLVQSRRVLGAVVDSLGLQLRPRTPAFPPSLLSQVVVDPRAAGDSVRLEFTPDHLTAQYNGRQVRAAYGQVLALGPVRFAVSQDPQVPEAVLDLSSREMAIDWLLGTLTVTQRPQTDLIDIVAASPDPRLAQRIVNRMVELFRSINIEGAKGKSRRRRLVLEEQLAQTDSTLARAQSELAAFRSRLQVGSSANKLDAEQNALLALESRRTELKTDRDTYAALLQRLQSGSDADRAEALRTLAGSPALGDNPQVAGLYQRLNTYELRLDSMTTGRWAAAPTNPDLLALRDMIKTTQGELVTAVGSHLTSLDARINSLGNLRQHGGQSIQTLPAMVEEEMRLASRVDVLSKLGEQLRQDYQRARLAEEVEAGDVEIVDLADLPYEPLWTIASIKFGIGLVLGLLFGGGLAFLLEALNTSIRRPEDIEAMLHLPGLAVIPRLEAGPPSGRPRARGLVQAAGKGRKLPGRTVGTETKPFSVGTEAFRMLRTSLIWSEGGERLRTLVVTSAAPGEGKTLTAANLAVSFANDGLHVLLVDCDIRRPRLHGLFRVPRSPGLLDLLTPPNGDHAAVGSLSFDASRSEGDDPLAHVLRPTPIHGLTLLTCGALPTNASNLLSGLRMRTLLQVLKERFDLVILDTPPVLATADAGILGGLTDGVLLVIRAGQTDRTAAQRAQQQLTNVGSRVVGAVLNDPKGELSQYGEYYYPYEYVVEPE